MATRKQGSTKIEFTVKEMSIYAENFLDWITSSPAVSCQTIKPKWEIQRVAVALKAVESAGNRDRHGMQLLGVGAWTLVAILGVIVIVVAGIRAVRTVKTPLSRNFRLPKNSRQSD
jgi:hypothetical protein